MTLGKAHGRSNWRAPTMVQSCLLRIAESGPVSTPSGSVHFLVVPWSRQSSTALRCSTLMTSRVLVSLLAQATRDWPAGCCNIKVTFENRIWLSEYHMLTVAPTCIPGVLPARLRRNLRLTHANSNLGHSTNPQE